MIIYKCAITDDELCSDIYPSKLLFDVLYEVRGSLRRKDDGGIDDSLIGGNPSAEGTDEGATGGGSAASGVAMVTDIVADYRLVETSYSKKDFKVYLKGYCGVIAEQLTKKDPGRVDGFKKGCQQAGKHIMENFNDYQFFTGESMNPDGMVVLSIWKGDGPVFYYFKDGLTEEKC